MAEYSQYPLKRSRSFWDEGAEDYDYAEQWREHYNMAHLPQNKRSRHSHQYATGKHLYQVATSRHSVLYNKEKALEIFLDAPVYDARDDDYDNHHFFQEVHRETNFVDEQRLLSSASSSSSSGQQHYQREVESVQQASAVLCKLKLDEREITKRPIISIYRNRCNDIWRSPRMTKQEAFPPSRYVSRRHCRRVKWADSNEIMTYFSTSVHKSTRRQRDAFPRAMPVEQNII